VTPGVRAEVQSLVQRLADGDRGALRPAFDRLWPLLRDFCARALRTPVGADAEDAAQRALVKLFDQASDFDPRRDALAWALTIAAFECRTAARSKGRRREDSLDDAAAERLASPSDGPEEAVIERDLITAARGVLAELPSADAEALIAAFEDMRPAGDAAFRKRLQRAVARLRIAWRAKHDA